jgi:hypothetical protein
VDDAGAGGGDDDGDSDDGDGGGSEETPPSHGSQPQASVFVVGDRVWYVKADATDRPGAIVAVHHTVDPPSYTIRFEDSEEERDTELTCLWHPETEAAEILVSFFGTDIAASRTMPRFKVLLDATTKTGLICRLITYFSRNPHQGHSALRGFKFRGNTHTRGDDNCLSYLTELGLYDGSQIEASFEDTEPAGPPPSPFTSQSTLSSEPSGDAHCDTFMGMADEPTTTLSITHEGVVWSIGKEKLETHLLAAQGRLYPGSDQQPGYAAVLASCDQSWVAFFRDLPELRANAPAAIDQIRNRLHTTFRRGFTGMAPDL